MQFLQQVYSALPAIPSINILNSSLTDSSVTLKKETGILYYYTLGGFFSKTIVSDESVNQKTTTMSNQESLFMDVTETNEKRESIQDTWTFVSRENEEDSSDLFTIEELKRDCKNYQDWTFSKIISVFRSQDLEISKFAIDTGMLASKDFPWAWFSSPMGKLLPEQRTLSESFLTKISGIYETMMFFIICACSKLEEFERTVVFIQRIRTFPNFLDITSEHILSHTLCRGFYVFAYCFIHESRMNFEFIRLMKTLSKENICISSALLYMLPQRFKTESIKLSILGLQQNFKKEYNQFKQIMTLSLLAQKKHERYEESTKNCFETHSIRFYASNYASKQTLNIMTTWYAPAKSVSF